MDLFGAMPAPRKEKRKIEAAADVLHREVAEEVAEEEEEEDGRAAKVPRTSGALESTSGSEEEEEEEVDIGDVIVRLIPLLASKSKFRKAAAMAHRLLAGGQIRGRDNARLFHLLLSELVRPLFDGTGAGQAHLDAEKIKPLRSDAHAPFGPGGRAPSAC